MEVFLALRGSSEFYFGDYGPDRFMWRFEEVRPLERPLLARGQQGLWTLTDEHVSALLDRVPADFRGRVEVS